MREINRLSVQQWLRSAISNSQQPISPIGFLFLKLPPPPCAVLLVIDAYVILKDVQKLAWSGEVGWVIMDGHRGRKPLVYSNFFWVQDQDF